MRLQEQAKKQEEVAKEFVSFREAMEAFGSKHGKIESNVSRMREELFS